jgi:hypothetical protein
MHLSDHAGASGPVETLDPFVVLSFYCLLLVPWLGRQQQFFPRGFLVSWLFGLVSEGLWQSEVASFQALQINKLIHWVEVFLEICPLNLHTECQSAGFIFTAACRGS